jgi:hypothetical protein
MRFRFLALAIILAIPVSAFSHGELFFPKVFAPSDLPTSGFVFVNPNPVTTTLNVYFIATSGIPQAQVQLVIPPGGQVAKLGNELFPRVSAKGWVYEQNPDLLEIESFWLNYNSDITAMDGSTAASAETLGSDQVIPLIGGQTELNIVNPNLTALNITIKLFGANGQLGSTVPRNLSAASATQAQIADLFPGIDIAQARYVRINGPQSNPIISSAVITNYLVPTDSLVVDAVTVTSASELTFPHVITGNLGSANYTTVLAVTNGSTSTQNISIVFSPDNGTPVTVTRTLEAGASLRDTAQNLFGLAGSFQGGSVKVTGSGALVGFAAYADMVGGATAGVPATTSRTRLFFSHIAEGPPQWQTGLALFNSNNVVANVNVYALNPDGTLIGGPTTVATAHFTLDPGKRIARVIHDLIPQTLGVNGGFVFISSDVAIHGLELFYSADLKVLANVAAGVHLGASYVPPLP